MKYKVGDKVKIKSLDWYNLNKTQNGYVGSPNDNEANFVKRMTDYCDKIAVIKKILGESYRIDLDDGFWSWNDFMFD